ncbi:MAG: AMP phosphorylase [archaeon]|nr:MAG: AMP phosphorylase [archaeon]
MLKVKKLDMDAGNLYIVVLNDKTLKKRGLRPLDRADVIKGRERLTCIINSSNRIVDDDEIGLYKCVAESLKLETGDEVKIEVQLEPKSVKYIKEKLGGKELDYREIREIVKDTVERDLTDVEIAAFITALELNGMTIKEAENLSRAMVETSKTINFGRKTYDKHSLGGIPGKKETLLIVPIVAAAGLTIPKTSSRAISSPAGTADIVETIAEVEFELDEIKRIVRKCKGCMVWGGAVDLAPADDIFVKVEYPLKIDPLFLPSVLSKKKAVNVRHVVIDIPTGRGAKIKTFMEANNIAQDFREVGRRLNMEVRCAITHGEQPVGHAIGPALEAREALRALKGRGPQSLVNKALGLSCIIFEMAGKKNPRELAEAILKSGKAEKKFRQIIGAQGGNPRIKPGDIPIGKNKFEVRSGRKGRVFWIRNDQIIEIARKLGAPKDKGAGILLNKKVGYPVKKNELLFTMYSENDKRFSNALKFLQHSEPIIVRESMSEEMLIDVIPSKRHRYKKGFFFER